jgi:hypothetical protein
VLVAMHVTGAFDLRRYCDASSVAHARFGDDALGERSTSTVLPYGQKIETGRDLGLAIPTV